MENFWNDKNVMEAISELAKKFAYPNEHNDKWEGIDKEIEKWKASHSLGVQNEKWVVGKNVEFDMMVLKENEMGADTVKVQGQILSITYYNEMADIFFTNPFTKYSERRVMLFQLLFKPQPLPQRTKLSDTRRIDFLEERIAYIEKKLNIEG